MTEPVLITTTQDAVRVLRLNRPEARNALNSALLDAIGLALAAAEADSEVRCVVLTGTGDKAFCAGMDLRSFSSGDTPSLEGTGGEYFLKFIRGEVKVPIVGAANATAVAGGLELLMGCDVVVASDQARFGLPEVQRGLFAAGGGVLLGARIPLAFALEIALTGDLISADRAALMGLVNHVVAADRVMETALQLAQRIAANGPLGVTATKELVRLSVTDIARAAQRQAELHPLVFGSHDAQEGALAFVEKRPPVWTGE